jgi:hypothetical protein
MCIIVDILVNYLLCVLRCMLLTCTPNFAEGAFEGLAFVHYQVQRHWHAFKHKQLQIFDTNNLFFIHFCKYLEFQIAQMVSLTLSREQITILWIFTVVWVSSFWIKLFYIWGYCGGIYEHNRTPIKNMSGCSLCGRGLIPGSGGDCMFLHFIHKSPSTAGPFRSYIQYLKT